MSSKPKIKRTAAEILKRIKKSSHLLSDITNPEKLIKESRGR